MWTQMTTDQLIPERPTGAQSDALIYVRIAVVAIAMVLVAVSIIMAAQAFGADVGASCGGG
jgi:hypothetical protein